MRRRRLVLPVLLATILSVLGGCAGTVPAPPGRPDLIRVGSANFPENRLLAEIYAIGLERRGVPVERRFSVGSREAYLPALLDGSVDLVPEYSGNLLLFLDPDTTAATSDQVGAELAEVLPSSMQLRKAAPAQNRDEVVVTQKYANSNGLRTLEELSGLCRSVTFGGPAEYRERPYGLPGLSARYGCTFENFRVLDAGGPQTVSALRDGSIQAAEMFSTDPAIDDNGFRALEDTKSNFPAQNIVPLISATKDADPRVGVLDEISARLDTRTLITLNRDSGRSDPTRVAKDWLTGIGIPGPP